MAIVTSGASAQATDALTAHVFDLVAAQYPGDVISHAREESLRILFLVSAHNGLSQRSLIALTEPGHDVAVTVVGPVAEMETAVLEHDPELIVCPFLKQMIPESIWQARRCLIVHPGPPGDRGPSSLDWAIELDERTWGSPCSRPMTSQMPARYGRHASSPCGARARAASTGTRFVTQRSRRS